MSGTTLVHATGSGASSSTTTGALRSAGGLGVVGDVNVGGTITGTLTNALTMAVAGTGLSGSASYNNSGAAAFTVTSNATNLNTASTIVARDGSGNFNAGVISATATTARYADVAEQYLADQEYDPGTVICIGGVYDITLCGLGDYPAGVISTNPAYLMNSELTAGLPVALVGRVPVRIFGSVTKGQRVYSDLMGRASKNAAGQLVGISLEDNASEGEKLVECMLKL